MLSFLPKNVKMLDDGDTTAILKEIRRVHNPLHWWVADWPLGNRFYRPVCTHVFELDEWLHPGNDYAFGFTTDILACLTTLGLFWLLRELTDSPWLTTLSTVLFYLWQEDKGHWLTPLAYAAAVATAMAGFTRHGFNLKLWLPPVLLWMWLAYEFEGVATLSFRMLGWIPGRTESTMTVFAMVSLAAFCRYLRLAPDREKPVDELTSTDRPATKGTERTAPKRTSAFWPVLSVITLLLALASYEQAVMTPAILGLIAAYWHFKGKRVPWGWGIPFAMALGAYIVVRRAAIPAGHSWYYDQRNRSTGVALFWLQRYLFVPVNAGNLVALAIIRGQGFWRILTTSLQFAGSFAALWEGRRRWLLCGFGWLASTLAYLPMAWFWDYNHYHYWPMAMRSIGVVALAWIACDLSAKALAPEGLITPARTKTMAGRLAA